MMTPHITQEQADEYAIGSLEPEMERVVSLHLAECPACRDVARDSERLASRLGMSTPIVPPAAPARLRRKVLTSAGIDRPSLQYRAFTYARTVTGVAAAVIALLAFTAMLGLRGQVTGLREQNAAFQLELDDFRSARIEVAALTDQVSEQARANALAEANARQDRELQVALLSPDAQTAEVTSITDDNQAVGRIVWDGAQNKLWFVATNLEHLDFGRTYQIWVNNDGRYVRLGTFNPDTTGFIRFSTEIPQGLADYDSAAVTIEKAGGSEERTSAPVLVANLEAIGR